MGTQALRVGIFGWCWTKDKGSHETVEDLDPDCIMVSTANLFPMTFAMWCGRWGCPFKLAATSEGEWSWDVDSVGTRGRTSIDVGRVTAGTTGCGASVGTLMGRSDHHGWVWRLGRHAGGTIGRGAG
jgi:hypothetical protein